MPYLPYISDELLTQFSKQVLDRVVDAYSRSDMKLHSNVIDPFSAEFDSAWQNLTLSQWIEKEKAIQVQKTLQNAIGDFHQNILGSVSGWDNPGRGGGFDIISKDQKVIAEIKNKFNTMNSSSSDATYRKLEKYINGDYIGFTSYVVFIVPKSPGDYDSLWSPNQEKYPLREDIRKTDGESFYKMVTGHSKALEMLFDCLPEVINKNLEKTRITEEEKGLFKQLFLKAYK